MSATENGSGFRRRGNNAVLLTYVTKRDSDLFLSALKLKAARQGPEEKRSLTILPLQGAQPFSMLQLAQGKTSSLPAFMALGYLLVSFNSNMENVEA